MYGSWDTEWDTEFLSFWVIFCPFTNPPSPPFPIPSKDPKNKNFKKNLKKCLEILSFYTYMCTMKIIWYMDDIWFLKYKVQQTDIFCHFGPLFALSAPWQPGRSKLYHFTQLHHKWQSYDVWFLRYGVHQAIFCHSVP